MAGTGDREAGGARKRVGGDAPRPLRLQPGIPASGDRSPDGEVWTTPAEAASSPAAQSCPGSETPPGGDRAPCGYCGRAAAALAAPAPAGWCLRSARLQAPLPRPSRPLPRPRPAPGARRPGRTDPPPRPSERAAAAAPRRRQRLPRAAPALPAAQSSRLSHFPSPAPLPILILSPSPRAGTFPESFYFPPRLLEKEAPAPRQQNFSAAAPPAPALGCPTPRPLARPAER